MPLSAGATAFAANLGHVLPVAAHDLSTFPASVPRLLRRELVRGALLVGRASPGAGDLALLGAVHRRKPSASTLFVHLFFLRRTRGAPRRTPQIRPAPIESHSPSWAENEFRLVCANRLQRARQSPLLTSELALLAI
jgi:hypothetical protein